MSRAVLFDTETTGLDPLNGDRMIEIALLELVRDLPTGQRLHLLIDPERDVPDEATRIHRRGRMTEAQINAVLARQMPDARRRRRADTVIHTGLSRFHAVAQLRRLLRTLR